MIKDRSEEIVDYQKLQEGRELHYAGYAYEIKRFAEYHYSEHKKEGYLHYYCFDGDNYSIVDDKKKAFIFGWSVESINTFINNLRNYLEKEGFQNVVLDYEWKVRKKPKENAIIPIATEIIKQGYIVHFYVNW